MNDERYMIMNADDGISVMIGSVKECGDFLELPESTVRAAEANHYLCKGKYYIYKFEKSRSPKCLI